MRELGVEVAENECTRMKSIDFSIYFIFLGYRKKMMMYYNYEKEEADPALHNAILSQRLNQLIIFENL